MKSPNRRHDHRVTALVLMSVIALTAIIPDAAFVLVMVAVITLALTGIVDASLILVRANRSKNRRRPR